MSGSGQGSAVDAFLEISLDTPGLFIWKLEGRKLQPVDCNDHGFFLEGTSYIVLRIAFGKTSSLHIWRGRLTTESDICLIHSLAHELDSIICHAGIFSREVQGHESLCFMRLFPEGIVYLEGGPHTSLSRTVHYIRRLYVVRGRKHVRAACYKPSQSALDSSLCVILDGYPRVYVWVGSNCGYVARVKAVQVARRIRKWQRHGKAHVVVIDENDHELNKSFLKKLDDEPEKTTLTQVNGHSEVVSGHSEAINEHSQTVDGHAGTLNGTAGTMDGHSGAMNGHATEMLDGHADSLNGNVSIISEPGQSIILHRVSGDSVLYDMPFAARKPLLYKYLVSSSSYLLDTGSGNPVYLWVGSRAPSTDVCKGLSRGQAFCAHRKYPEQVSVCRILEGSEPGEFRQAFNHWRDKHGCSKHNTKKYSAGNMIRSLVSQSCKRPSTKMSVSFLEDCDETYLECKVYILKDGGLVLIDKWDHGKFNNGHCYVINFQHGNSFRRRRTLYYWMGSKSEISDKKRVLEVCLAMEAAYQHEATMVRVLDGDEPNHMMSVFDNSIVVFDKDLEESSSSVELFSVTEISKGNIRVAQVPPTGSSLNSAAAFVAMSREECFLWYGKNSGGPEREYAKYILGYLHPARTYNYDIVIESKEGDAFWALIGGKTEYDAEYTHTSLERRHARLFHCCLSAEGTTFEEMVDFEQEDLSEQDIMVCDTSYQIILWYGTTMSTESRERFPDIVEEYLSQDQAGRSSDNLQLSYVCQGHEPHSFTKFFRSWYSAGFGGQEAYDLCRKHVRQENARTNVKEDLFKTSHQLKTKYPYKTLVKRDLPNDVDPSDKQNHLTDQNFLEVFKLSRFQFYQLPEWKQRQILKLTRLSFCTTHISSSDEKRVPTLTLPLET